MFGKTKIITFVSLAPLSVLQSVSPRARRNHPADCRCLHCTEHPTKEELFSLDGGGVVYRAEENTMYRNLGWKIPPVNPRLNEVRRCGIAPARISVWDSLVP